MAQHITEHANRGAGHTSYLSKTIYEELIILIAKKTLLAIVEDIKSAGFFSVSVDSTPDISHVDQLTIVFRYVLPSGPLERFLAFINISSHTDEALANYLLDFMNGNGLDISFVTAKVMIMPSI